MDVTFSGRSAKVKMERLFFFLLFLRVYNGELALATGTRRVFATTCACVCLRWDVQKNASVFSGNLRKNRDGSLSLVWKEMKGRQSCRRTSISVTDIDGINNFAIDAKCTLKVENEGKVFMNRKDARKLVRRKIFRLYHPLRMSLARSWKKHRDASLQFSRSVVS